jgi:hypothetical protein
MVHCVERGDRAGAVAVLGEQAQRTLGLRPTDVEEIVEQTAELLPQLEV